MTHAYRCDECESFDEGDPTLSLTMQVDCDDTGLLGELFGMGSGPSATFDFCSIGCAESFDFDSVRGRLIGDIENKQAVLEAEANDPEPVVDPTEGIHDG